MTGVIVAAWAAGVLGTYSALRVSMHLINKQYPSLGTPKEIYAREGLGMGWVIVALSVLFGPLSIVLAVGAWIAAVAEYYFMRKGGFK